LIFLHVLFYHYQEGEPVEFTAHTDERGRLKAEKVTGPMGALVQGAPRRTFQDNVRSDSNGKGTYSYEEEEDDDSDEEEKDDGYPK
jgi:hypothetical protein